MLSCSCVLRSNLDICHSHLSFSEAWSDGLNLRPCRNRETTVRFAFLHSVSWRRNMFVAGLGVPFIYGFETKLFLQGWWQFFWAFIRLKGTTFWENRLSFPITNRKKTVQLIVLTRYQFLKHTNYAEHN